jgi:hypothetical protein
MKRRFSRMISLAFLLSTPGHAVAQNHTVALVRADLVKVEDISPPLKQGEVRLDGEMRLTFRVRKVLAGSLASRVAVHTQWSGMPYLGETYVLIREEDGISKVAWWSRTRDGLCFDLDEARHDGLEEQVRRLQKAHPCRAS